MTFLATITLLVICAVLYCFMISISTVFLISVSFIFSMSIAVCYLCIKEIFDLICDVFSAWMMQVRDLDGR